MSFKSHFISVQKANFLHLIVCSDPEDDFKAQTVIHVRVLHIQERASKTTNIEREREIVIIQAHKIAIKPKTTPQFAA